MKIEKLPGLENSEDLQQILKSLDSAIYWSRRHGRFNSADQFEETFKGFLDVKFLK
ncbi:MAG: hypothetical protein ACW9W4_01255 [Candidatus Nitrosopumilus sp. bin_7KS]